MNKVIYRSKFQSDLRSIYIHYLLYADADTAKRHINDILEGINLIAELPDIGRVIEDSAGFIGPGYRQFLKNDFWIIYSFAQDTLTIWTVYSAKQNIDGYEIVDFNFKESC